MLGDVATQENQGRADDPSVFDYVDYRLFLKALQESRKVQGRISSNAAFARKGGLESPNYWGLVLSGKRNLSPVTVQKFSKAVGISGKAALYFENLVFFNQARTVDERQAYFDRLKTLAIGERSKPFSLLSSHVEVLSNWYCVAIREMVSLANFSEDDGFIFRSLKSKVTRKEIREAIDTLLKTGLLARDSQGRLQPAEPHVNYKEAGANFAVRNLHLQMINRAQAALLEDSVENRNMTSSTLSFRSSDLPLLKKDVEEFTNKICMKYGNSPEVSDSVIQFNSQMFYLTDLDAVSAPKPLSQNSHHSERNKNHDQSH
jgi:uncharacterized protein (TIGR02147 family)